MTNDVKNVPELRFPEFEGEWRLINLKNFFHTIKNGFVGMATPFYTDNSGVRYLQSNNVKNGCLNDNVKIYVTKEFNEKYKSNQLKSGDMLMVQSGHAGATAVVSDAYEGSNCHALIIMKPKSNINTIFLNNYFQSRKGVKSIYSLITGNTIKHILSSDVKKITCSTPVIKEQKKIGDFFSKLDRQIELEEQKLVKLEEQKKGYMQKIFSQELRFKDENGNNYPEWEAQKLGEISDKGMYGIGASAIDFDGSNIYVRITDIDSDSNKMSKKHLKSPNIIDNKYKLKSNDLLFARTGASTGKSYIHKNYLEDKNYYFAGFLIKFAIKKPNSAEFVYQFTHTKVYDRWVKIMSMRSGQPGINSVEYSNLVLNIPRTKEQQKIGEFLNKFDELIEKQNQKIDVLKVRKQGFLQKMFI